MRLRSAALGERRRHCAGAAWDVAAWDVAAWIDDYNWQRRSLGALRMMPPVDY